MYAVIEKSFGGLTPPYYLCYLYFALILPLMLLAQVSHQPGSGGMFLLTVVNTLLYPYARFLYERVWGFIMGDTKFMLGILWVSLGKLVTMTACWCSAVFLAPISLVYLYYPRERTVQQWPAACKNRKKGWTILVKRLLPVPAGVSIYFYTRFATGDETIGDEWYRFKTMADMPPCSKYDYPTRDLEFRVPPLCHSSKIATVDLRTVLVTLPDNEQLNLNPARWSCVRRDLSEGWCYTSWMGVEQRRANLTDGRHRIVATMKFLGLEYVEFVVQPEHIATVWAQVKTR